MDLAFNRRYSGHYNLHRLYNTKVQLRFFSIYVMNIHQAIDGQPVAEFSPAFNGQAHLQRDGRHLSFYSRPNWKSGSTVLPFPPLDDWRRICLTTTNRKHALIGIAQLVNTGLLCVLAQFQVS